jgi:regulator of protease activity HflC (stomatin/prohibitin superfamily)
MIDKLIDFLISVIDLGRCWVVLDPDEEGVMLRMGGFHKRLESGRWYLKLPLRIDRERLIKVTTDTHNLSSQGLCTSDGVEVNLSVIVRFRIKDAYKALLEVQDRDNVIKDCVLAEVCYLVQEHRWEEVRQAAFGEKLTKASRKQGHSSGVDILSVRLTDCSTTANVTLVQIASA